MNATSDISLEPRVLFLVLCRCEYDERRERPVQRRTEGTQKTDTLFNSLCHIHASLFVVYKGRIRRWC